MYIHNTKPRSEIKKLLRNCEGSNGHFFKKLSGLDDNLVSYKKKECTLHKQSVLHSSFSVAAVFAGRFRISHLRELCIKNYFCGEKRHKKVRVGNNWEKKSRTVG